MARIVSLLGLIALVTAAVSCSPREPEPGTEVAATFDIFRTTKQDCGGPNTCRISFLLNVEGETFPMLYQCDVQAIDPQGAIVASGSLPAAVGTVAKVPIDEPLTPKVRRTVASVGGDCVVADRGTD